MPGEIARCLADMVTLPVPTVCLLLGEGAGGGALALLPADRVVAAQHGWVAPLPPEGASEILYRTIERAPELAAAQGVRSADLAAVGHRRPHRARATRRSRRATGVPRPSQHAPSSTSSPPSSTGTSSERLDARYQRYRNLGLHPEP